ncbi:MAG: hypothetical protein K2I74_03315 [Treponemataceae bacterium]|nr:hypothetical protein [Treponemataceae bacterium]
MFKPNHIGCRRHPFPELSKSRILDPETTEPQADAATTAFSTAIFIITHTCFPVKYIFMGMPQNLIRFSKKTEKNSRATARARKSREQPEKSLGTFR